MPKLALAHIEGHLVGFGHERVPHHSRRIDESPDEPDTAEAIDMGAWPGDPAFVAIGLDGRGSDRRRQPFTSGERLRDPRQP